MSEYRCPAAKRLFRSPSAVYMRVLPEARTLQRDCRKANGLCLVCGSGDHLRNDCPFRRTKNIASVQPALPVLPVMRKPGSTSRGSPLPSQQHAFSETQEGRRTGADSRRSQVYHLTAEEAEASHEEVTRCDAQYLEQEPWWYHHNWYPIIFASCVGNLSYPFRFIILSLLTLVPSVFISFLIEILRTKFLLGR